MLRFTKYGKPLPQICLAAFVLDLIIGVVATVLLYQKVSPTTGIVFAVIFGLLTIPLYAILLLFFRDPIRKADREPIPANVMLAPADGKVTEISHIDDPRVGGPALKIGIFLSVFNVHINRVPCNAKVIESVHKCGQYLNAMNPDSSHRNECNDLTLEPTEQNLQFPKRIVVRQIAGLIAKRIVAAVNPGEIFKSGQQFGMIKFGSRTELIVPASPEPKIMVKVGQKVRAGDDILLMY